MRTEPTQQELRAAFEHHRARRPAEWPEDFDEAMAHPTLSRLVRITAMHPMRAQRKPAPARARPVMPITTRPIFDRKRAAAGEREDD